MLLENVSTKFAKDDKILLNENDKSTCNYVELCQMFLDTSLSLISTHKDISKVTDINDLVLAAINVFKGHLRIKSIREKKILNQFFLLYPRTKQV